MTRHCPHIGPSPCFVNRQHARCTRQLACMGESANAACSPVIAWSEWIAEENISSPTLLSPPTRYHSARVVCVCGGSRRMKPTSSGSALHIDWKSAPNAQQPPPWGRLMSCAAAGLSWWAFSCIPPFYLFAGNPAARGFVLGNSTRPVRLNKSDRSTYSLDIISLVG